MYKMAKKWLSWTTVTEEGNGDESDKHIQARDRRYSCLKLRGRFYQSNNNEIKTFIKDL